MSSKRFNCIVLSLLAIVLILVMFFMVAIDPLFQYRVNSLGLQPVITDERYQNAGVAKNFEYDNVIIGNSMSENFKVYDFEKEIGGETVKLVVAGSHTLDWTYTLDILRDLDSPPKKVMFNLDPYILDTSYTEIKHDLPIYLYDKNILNDINYIFNFQILNDFAIDSIAKNKSGDIPDYNEAFVWDDEGMRGKENVLKNYERHTKSKEVVNIEEYKDIALNNIYLLDPYIQDMQETEFVFFVSPFSMLFWDGCMMDGVTKAYENCYISTFEHLLSYDNVSVYMWTDEEMFEIMSDLNYYIDDSHYTEEINHMILERIGNGNGKLTQENYIDEINKLFDYIYNYDYDSLYE